MRSILIAEMVKKGYRSGQITKVIAITLGCSERTVRNKINNVTDFTVSEALIINNKIFNDKIELKYLFQNNASQ